LNPWNRSSAQGASGRLRPYQLQGLSYLNFLRKYGFGGILADEMGLGKTVQTLAFIQHMINKHEGPNLIVVPTSVLPNWDREAQKFLPNLRRLLIYGINREPLFKRSRKPTWSSPPMPCCAGTWTN
jgi:non-specific serine/threonine protein kinase